MTNGEKRISLTVSLKRRHVDFLELVSQQAGLGLSETLRAFIENFSDHRPKWNGPLLTWVPPDFRRDAEDNGHE
jgi:hypothetical protein